MPIDTLRPNGEGDLQNIPSTTPPGYPYHWELVDDVEPDDGATQVFRAGYAGSSSDLYTIEPPTAAYDIQGITLFIRVRVAGYYVYLVRPSLLLKTHGTIYEYILSEDKEQWWNYSWTHTVNPYTLLPWTLAELASLQVGVTVRSNWGYRRDAAGYCTQIYVEVDYAAAIPTVTTNPATSVAASSAVLNGILNQDGGEACDCGFEWGETIGYGNTTPTQSRTTGQTFAQTISGLDPKKTYHFRALVTNSAGPGHGADRTFTTLAVAPTVATNPAIDINNDSATLKGELTYDGGEACNCSFEYGETETYGTTTPTQSKVTGEAFSQPIQLLDANKTYHFRAIATNSAVTSHGADRTFKTLASAPAVTTKPATGLGAVLATLNGTLDNDIGEACECGFEWGLDTDYGTITPTESKITDEDFSQVIGGLFPNTTYHFRAFATNSFGTGYGDDMSFTTALVINRAFALARSEL